MRKQTKLVAVLSAAALLAIGASMTSFAAWAKSDDGTWQYFDRDGEMVTGNWQKDGAKWFYLDDDGNMLTDSWVDDESYVGDDGAMIVNDWKKTTADEEVGDPEDDGDNWYYFGSKGKKVVSDSKKVGGKTYYFDSDGKMEDGWYQDGNDIYYLGEEDDGARKAGWLWLEKPDDDANVICDDNCAVGCDEEGWYHFGSDGTMYSGANKKKVNGKYYYFNDHGQMLYEWINGNAVVVGTPGNLVLDGNVATPGNTPIEDMVFTNVVEEGWRADGWYDIDGSKSTGTNNDSDWYYFKDGVAKHASTVTDGNANVTDDGVPVYRARIKVLGKYFCFNEKGQMQTGLQYIPAQNGFYYFDDNGYMKTGKLSSVEEENDTFSYYFQTKNGNNGKGVTDVKDGYLYWNGKRLEADDDYKLYDVGGNIYLVNNKGKIQKSDSKKYDLENTGNEDVTFTFSGSKVINSSDSTAMASAVVPSIELYDNKFTQKLVGSNYMLDIQ